MLINIKHQLAPCNPGIEPPCPTRWTVGAKSLRSVITNYDVIMLVLEEIMEEYKGNFEVCCQARGVLTTMETFQFLFGVISEEVFSITNKLSKALQRKGLSAIAAKKFSSITICALKELRNDSKFEEFWVQTTAKATELGIGEPTLPRKRNVPRRFDEASGSTYHDSTPEDMYKGYYFEIIDTIVGEIERQFESPSFLLYTIMESLLHSAAEGKEISDTLLKEVVDHFDDLELLELRTELSLLKNVMASMEFTYPNLKTKVNEYQAILPKLMKLLQLLLVIPATLVTSERSFSSLCLKTFLRTTMNQERLNYLMMIYIHKERPTAFKGAMKEFIQ